MKRVKLKYYLIIALIFSFGCNKTPDEPIIADATTISGKWKETEAFISAGGPQYWVNVENGEEIEFLENGTFTSDRFGECIDGNYSIADNELQLKYSCDGFNSESENEEGFITYKIEIYSNYFLLTPTSGPICIEGCSYKYEKKK
jgi:hypothetical protein